MANKKQKQSDKPIGKKAAEKKPLIDPRYKSAVSTAIILLILIIFFIFNNTRKEPERGPYPPFYKQGQNK